MAIPDYQSIMLPLLKLTADKNQLSLRDAVKTLSDQFRLTDKEKSELLTSGQQPVFHNRVHWARAYLLKAGLLEAPSRGIVQITKRGLKVIEQKPSKINNEFLWQFTEFRDFKSKNHEKESHPQAETGLNSSKTPDAIMEATYQEIRQSLAQELLVSVKKCSPQFFERLVIQLLVKMGYGGTRQDAAKAIGKSGDEGIDGIIKEDRLGLDCIYIQAKRWEGVVGRPEIQKFVGALHGMRAKKGIFITTSSFTKESEQYVSKIESTIILIDGGMLSNLMIDHGIGTSTIETYELKKIDADFFVDE